MSDRLNRRAAGQTPLELLELMMRRAAEREPQNYFIGILDEYARQHALSNEAIAAFLGIETRRPWLRLALCGRPRVPRHTFWPDVQAIAAETGADPDRLVTLVRTVEALQALRELSIQRTANERGALAAARDRTDDLGGQVTSADAPYMDAVATETLPLWLDAGSQMAITDFWEAAGASTPEPSFLERDALRSLPCLVIYLPHLALSRIEGWLASHEILYRFPCPNRYLRGCLLAYRGYGLIFIDSEDTVNEQCYTLAHELVHLILDYLRPRGEAIARLGPDVAEVLDGQRPATHEEQVNAVFEQVSIDGYFHLLDRAGTTSHGAALRPKGAWLDASVRAAETVADRIALELLAPRDVVMARLAELGISNLGNDQARFIAATHEVLQQDYQLPQQPALVYAATLASAFTAPTLENWLDDL